MTTLRGQSPKDTFGDLIHISNNGVGIDDTQRQIVDGLGNNIPMRMSTQAVSLDKIASYRMALVQTTGVMDVSMANVFKVTVTGNLSVTFANNPDAATFMTIVVVLVGNNGTVTWPASVIWDGGVAPTLGATRTLVTMAWDGTNWVGSVGAKV